jgi:sec-independent protein translocase protein TatB
MFEVGWTEMLVIAVVMIVVVGPKDLPKMLRTIGKMTAKMRSMAGDFQKQFNEALKEAELDEVKKSVDSLRSMNPVADIKKQLNPFEQAAADVRAGLQSAMGPKPSVSSEPANPATHEAEPLKNGATAMPGVAGPETMPEPPVGLATPMPSPEAAKPSAAATPMSDPRPAGGNGASAPAKTTARAPKAEAKAKPAAAKPASAKSAPAKTAVKAASAPAKSAAAVKAKPASQKPAGKPK